MFSAPDIVKSRLKRKIVETVKRQVDEKRDPTGHVTHGLGEGVPFDRLAAVNGRGIGNSQMCRHRLTGLNPACFIARIVTDRKNEIHDRCIRHGKFVPALGAQRIG